MIPEQMKPPGPEPSAEREETQPEDLPQEDPDTAHSPPWKSWLSPTFRQLVSRSGLG